jgi:hypothetical protein
LHDFDKSGFSILGTLTRDTRRYAFDRAPEVVDLGLRLSDVRAWGLQSEEMSHTSDPSDNLELNGATPEEIEFLRGERTYYGPHRYRGQRVELNAFTSEQFVRWLESKLTEHRVEKVFPDGTTLEQAYRRAVGLREYRTVLRSALNRVHELTAAVEAPATLTQMLADKMAASPELPWDIALEQLLD